MVSREGEPLDNTAYIDGMTRAIIGRVQTFQTEVNKIMAKSEEEKQKAAVPPVPEGKMRVRLRFGVYSKPDVNFLVDVPSDSKVHFEPSQKVLTIRDPAGTVLYAHTNVQQAWVENTVVVTVD